MSEPAIQKIKINKKLLNENFMNTKTNQQQQQQNYKTSAKTKTTN